MPCFTVLVSRIMLNERQPGKVYASLVPIIVGVFTASVTELQFDSMGLFSSLFSTLIFAFLNVLAKKVVDFKLEIYTFQLKNLGFRRDRNAPHGFAVHEQPVGLCGLIPALAALRRLWNDWEFLRQSSHSQLGKFGNLRELLT